RHAHQGGPPRGSGFNPARAASVAARLERPLDHRKAEGGRDHARRHRYRQRSAGGHRLRPPQQGAAAGARGSQTRRQLSDRQQLSRLSEEKLGQRLDGEARLAGARVDALFSTTAARLETIAQRADVVKAISSANVVPISELLGRAALAADIDGILVVDAKLRV